MMEAKNIKNVVMYEKTLKAVSIFNDMEVEIIGEQTYVTEEKEIPQYLYNIVDHPAENGLPYVSMKNNLALI